MRIALLQACLLLAFNLFAQQPVPFSQAQVKLTYWLDDRQMELTGAGPMVTDKVVRLQLGEKEVEGGRYLFAMLDANADVVLESMEFVVPMNSDGVESVFTNGFQGWTTAMEYEKNAKLAGLKKIAHGIAGHYGDYKLYKYPKKKGVIHGWTYAYTRLNNGNMHLLGSLDEYTGYTLLQYNTKAGQLAIGKDCKGTAIPAHVQQMALYVFEANGTDSACFAAYAGQYEQQLETKLVLEKPDLKLNPLPEAIPGWTSWYHYYHDIDESIILENLRAFQKYDIPIEIFQIDDGYQRSVGEWTQTNEKFPNGMKPIADSIHAAGFKAGIWLAPFICEKKSAIYEQHPDWLLRDEKGEPVVAGLNPGWSGKYYGLDIYNPEVRQFVKSTLDTILNVYGYDMIKTDFLFAVGMVAPEGKNRAQVMIDALLLLREAAGDKLILGCGVPLGPAFRLVDYCRISSDIHMKWEQKVLRWLDARERLSCWNSQTTVIGRRQLSGNFFLNDPDVFVLRSEKNKLKPHQKATMFLVNNLFGELVLHSDNIANYSPEQMEQYRSAFPLLEKTIDRVEKDGDVYQAWFTIGNRQYVAFINLAGKKRKVNLPDGRWFDGKQVLAHNITLKGYRSVCMYHLKLQGFEVLGGEGYLFPGAEVASLELTDDKHLTLTWLPQAQPKPVYIRIPENLDIQQVNGQPVERVWDEKDKMVLYRP